ncbi:MAG: bifunctional demethylmenaquinone methyltransferase/2-methoxy-6-polyprenyl-1,4-benzoquinol methylase UbiE [Gammaproteobacteria bacterium]|nr:bifunctional demethylmenaquinone methyltransferase/2-methoxy-6-polyprenyl-1,4-benzoquinol methylase UbiE [Gammaproteobacteria bacterium]
MQAGNPGSEGVPPSAKAGKPSRPERFGFSRVSPDEKTQRVRGVFDSVADRYDLMNDLMSLGAHRLWKRFALARTGLRPGGSALDVAGGTGDLAIGMSRQVGPQGRVLLSDVNPAMLRIGRSRLLDAGAWGNTRAMRADATSLPVGAGLFDCVTIGFGLRNVTGKPAALKSMARVVKPGGRLLVLEFSRPALKFIRPAYDWYSFAVIPALGRVVAGDAESYRYLVESIRVHPDQETLAQMMREAGFESVRWHNLSGGIVALHIGFRH